MKGQSSPQKPNLNVVVRTNQPIEAVLTQINEMNQDQLGEVLRAIASRIHAAE